MVDLTRIELENFGPFYKKTHDVTLGLSKKKLVIFEGENGGGKTTIINAISWCLFGFYLS